MNRRKHKSIRQRGVPRARSLSEKKMGKTRVMEDRKLMELMGFGEEFEMPRPKTREECRGHARPCPWVGCKHHLYLDVNPETGSIKINFPDLEPWELQHTCALDVAERGGITLEEVGEIINLTRERIRQVEVRGLLKLKLNGGKLRGDE